jgi:lipopolysaccharide/colanic/teichoic acid biosynthesis glycosyltransferase
MLDVDQARGGLAGPSPSVLDLTQAHVVVDLRDGAAAVQPSLTVCELSFWAGAAKRGFDVGFSLAVLILGLPVFLAAAVLVRVTSPGPALFGSERVGRHGQRFRCWKFRSMTVDAQARLDAVLAADPARLEEYCRTRKLRDDPRVTRVGRVLRRTSLDELPQFFNVLKGDMSVVGPRPILEQERSAYGAALSEITRLRPGITGLWQVSGRNDIPFEGRVTMDCRYAAQRSVALDATILARTLGRLVRVRGNGAY